jgi:3-keto-disaccharide hydrolase
MKPAVGIRIVSLSLSFVLVAGLAIPGMSGARKSTSNIYAAAPSTIALDSLEGLEIQAAHDKGLDPVKVTADVATYGGRRALHLLNDDSVIVKGNSSGGQSLAIVKGSDFKDGTIEVEVVGLPRQGSPPDTRGFVGLAFHVQDHGSQFEAFYLRFTNGRAEDQPRRNHTTQYVSEPDFPWFRLRVENPGMYESYVDIEPKAWTKLKVTVTGTKARLYINNATQPCLIVNDLKLGDTHGQVALWNGSDTEAYFSNLRIE